MSKIGLVLSSGAARGWAHIGAITALEEMGVRPDIVVGASAGALVGGAWLVDALDALEEWGAALGPLNAAQFFQLAVARGGLINADRAFEAFQEFECAIETLPVTFAAVATDLTSGEAHVIDKGPLMSALRASSAIPVLFNAVERDGLWLVDGALSNPMPVSAARTLGADIAIAVDLNARPRVLDRLPMRHGGPPALVEQRARPTTLSSHIAAFVGETRDLIERQIAMARAKALATPRFVETAVATAEIFQAQLTAARAEAAPPDILIAPDLRDAQMLSFDNLAAVKQAGYDAVMAQRAEIEARLESA